MQVYLRLWATLRKLRGRSVQALSPYTIQDLQDKSSKSHMCRLREELRFLLVSNQFCIGLPTI